MFIVLEGADGVGKSTHADAIASRLAEETGRPVHRLHEPTTGPWGQKIRTAAATGTRPEPAEEVAWFIEDRREDVAQNIQPALDRDEFVVLDRYFYSSAAYQGARGVPREEILRRNRAFAPEPDLCIFLVAGTQEARRRIGDRGDTPDAFEGLSYQQQVAAAFEELYAELAAAGEVPVLRVDTERPKEVVAEEIWQRIQSLHSSRG